MDLADVLNREFGTRPDGGYVVVGGAKVPISDCRFHEIPTTNNPRTVAYVDGGSSILMDTPAYSVTLNRLFCSMLRGKKILHNPSVPSLQFYSLLRRMRGGLTFTLFPYGDRPEVLPDVDILDKAAAGSWESGEEGLHRLMSLPRVLGEWRTARAATRRLSPGDCLVMDGSLSMGGHTRREPARSTMEDARTKDVVFCGLSKSTDLCLDNGWPLLDYFRDKYSDRRITPWYVDIGRPPANPRAGDVHTMVVMLHGATNWLYRLDMDAVTRAEIGPKGVEEVLASIAIHSDDAYLPGYPYGLSYADRYAQVRHGEAKVYATQIIAMMDKPARRITDLNAQHEYLNRVTG